MKKKFIISMAFTFAIVRILQDFQQYNFLSFIVGYTYGLILWQWFEKGGIK